MYVNVCLQLQVACLSEKCMFESIRILKKEKCCPSIVHSSPRSCSETASCKSHLAARVNHFVFSLLLEYHLLVC